MRLKDKMGEGENWLMPINYIKQANEFYRRWYTKSDKKYFENIHEMSNEMKESWTKRMTELTKTKGKAITFHEFNLWLHDYVYGVV